jgi:hypothetical protein
VRLTGAKDLFNVTIFANFGALIKDLTAKAADKLLVRDLKDIHKGFICFDKRKNHFHLGTDLDLSISLTLSF